VPGQYVASRPLEVVQLDHTEVDLFLVDATTREAMGARPWVTLAIDVFTRMVVGFHLSMDKPSRVSIGLCMLSAVYDKGAWLKENAIDARWPIAGLPEALHADNSTDFRSKAFSWACREEGIKLIWRPVGAPHYGGHIERLIGTIMGACIFIPVRPSPIPPREAANVLAGARDERVYFIQSKRWIAYPKRNVSTTMRLLGW
jgi:putative transposase